MNVVTLVFRILSGFLWLGIVNPFKDEIEKIDQALWKLKKKVNYGRLLLGKINTANYELNQGVCGCLCGGPGGTAAQVQDISDVKLSSDESNSAVAGLPEGPQTRGITRGPAYWNRGWFDSGPTTTVPGFANMPKTNSEFFTTAYYNLLYNLQIKAKRERMHYRDLVANIVEYYKSRKFWLMWMGDPIRDVVQTFLEEISDPKTATSSQITYPVTSRLGNFKRRATVWSDYDRIVWEEMNTAVKDYPTEGNRLLDLIAKIKTHKIDERKNTGEQLAKDILDAFIDLYYQLGWFLKRKVNTQLSNYNYIRRRLSGRRNSIRVKRILHARRKYSNLEDELYNVERNLEDMEDKVKYSRLLLEDLEMETTRLRGVEECVCPACPNDGKTIQEDMDFVEVFTAYTLPNYYDTVNNGYLTVAYEMFMDAIQGKRKWWPFTNPCYYVLIHAKKKVTEALLSGHLDWLGTPMKRAIYSTAVSLSDETISDLQNRSLIIATMLNSRYTSLSTPVNNVLDYANSLISHPRGKSLIRTMELFERLPISEPPEDVFMKQIVDGFINLFADKIGSPEIKKLSYFADRVLVDRYPGINTTLILPGGRRNAVKKVMR